VKSILKSKRYTVITLEIEQKLLRAYLHYKSLKKTANHLNMDVKTVRKYITMNGLIPPPRDVNYARQFSHRKTLALSKKVLIAAAKENKSLREVAAEFNVKYDTLQKFLYNRRKKLMDFFLKADLRKLRIVFESTTGDRFNSIWASQYEISWYDKKRFIVQILCLLLSGSQYRVLLDAYKLRDLLLQAYRSDEQEHR
jgi:hypothetical protein